MKKNTFKENTQEDAQGLELRDVLELPSAVPREKQEEIYRTINKLVFQTGVDKSFTHAVDANISAFKANVSNMLNKVDYDLHSNLIELIDDLVRCTEKQHVKFLLEIRDVIVDKQKAEAHLRASKAEKDFINKLNEEQLEYANKLLQKKTEQFSKIIEASNKDLEKAAKQRREELIGATSTERELRQAISQVYGIAQTINFLNYTSVKDKILKVLEIYV